MIVTGGEWYQVARAPLLNGILDVGHPKGTTMIRALLTVAAPVAVAALAAVPLAGAGLSSFPVGEPIMVAAAPGPLHKASFDGCAASPAKADEGAVRIVAFTLTGRDGGVSVAARRCSTRSWASSPAKR